MLREPRVLLINPPMLIVEPDYMLAGTPGKFHIKAMNPGLLIIASYLCRHDINVKIIDLSFNTNFNDMEKELEKELSDFRPNMVGISSTSAYDYLESLQVAKAVKAYDESIILFIGGQQAGPLGEIVFRDSPDIDIVSTGEGEWVTLEMCRRYSESLDLAGIPGTILKKGDELINATECAPQLSFDEIGGVNYPLYPRYQEFTPFIEQSRGCPGACAYCLNKQVYKSKVRRKSKESIREQVKELVRCFGKDRLVAVLASNFGSTAEEAIEFAEIMKETSLQWTTEFRIDAPWEEFIDICYESGFVFCNIGLEGTNEMILRRMRKTTDPQGYVSRFDKLVEKINQLEDLKLRVNMMTYIGMTTEELKHDLAFLIKHSDSLDAVLYTTLQVPEATDLMTQMDMFSQKYGCRLHMTEYAKKTHMYPVDVSAEISFEEGASWCSVMEKIFASPTMYEGHKTGNYAKYESLLKKGDAKNE